MPRSEEANSIFVTPGGAVSEASRALTANPGSLGQTCSRTLRSMAVATMRGIRGCWLARGDEATAVA